MAIVVTTTTSAKSLLYVVNKVLKRTQHITSDLSSLTDNAKQVAVNIAIQSINEVVRSLYTEAKMPMPQEVSHGALTLEENVRTYSLSGDLIQLRFPLIDQTNGDRIYEYPGGYTQLFIDQDIPSNYTGLPQLAAISPINGQIYLDRLPTTNEAGREYVFLYDKDLTLSDASDTFPFSNVVAEAIVPAAAQLVKGEMQNKFNEGIFKMAMGQAARMLSQTAERRSYLPQVTIPANTTDPMEK